MKPLRLNIFSLVDLNHDLVAYISTYTLLHHHRESLVLYGKALADSMNPRVRSPAEKSITDS
jgi:hypothetical protein